MAIADVTTVDAGERKVSRRVVVNAPASAVFDLIADPHQHPKLDGSGTVRDIEVKGPQRLSQGDKFSVGMKQYGVPYKITSKVTELRENQVVEWKHPLGHKWRWELEETSPGTTQVTETFDYSTTPLAPVFKLTGQDKQNAGGITKTLEALAAQFA